MFALSCSSSSPAQDLDAEIDAGHFSWLGKKKAWKQKVWQVLEDRMVESSLLTQKYVVVVDVEEKMSEQKVGTSAASSSSATEWLGFQTTLNEAASEKGEEQEALFPAPPPVETADTSDPLDDTKGDPKETQEALEHRMKRWVEMVESVEMLEKIDWLSDVTKSTRNDAGLAEIFGQGMKYCRDFMTGVLLPWKFDHFPLNPMVWCAEMERTLKIMSKRGCLPYWLKRPHDRNIRDDASESADGFSDPGNYDLDVFVHALRLWRYVEGGHRVSLVMKQSIAEYGSNANKSAHGPVNLRGNIVEAMTKNLQTDGTKKKGLIRTTTQWRIGWRGETRPRRAVGAPRGRAAGVIQNGGRIPQANGGRSEMI